MKMPPYSEESDRFRDDDRFIEQMLREEMPFTLPAGFADRVSDKFVKRLEQKQRLIQFLIHAGVILAGLLVAALVIYFFSPENRETWQGILSGNASYLIQLLVAVLFILFVDKVLLPMKMVSGNKHQHP
jgi:hypothetical protein